ncbi:MAG: phage holin family protein [bacterium]|nr:phage holin family protein [bacterium]
MSLILRLLGSALALYAADYLLPGFIVIGGFKGYLAAGIILGLLNLIVKPILKVIAFPVILLTLGLFTLVINALLIWGAGQLTGYVFFDNYYTLLWATLVVAAVNVIVGVFRKIL